MPQVTQQQEQQFRQLVGEIGLVPSMRIFTDWLNGQARSAQPEVRDHINKVVQGLTDAQTYLQGITGETGLRG